MHLACRGATFEGSRGFQPTVSAAFLVRKGGEQPEVKDQSVGDELDSAKPVGETASNVRTLFRATLNPAILCDRKGLRRGQPRG